MITGIVIGIIVASIFSKSEHSNAEFVVALIDEFKEWREKRKHKKRNQ